MFKLVEPEHSEEPREYSRIKSKWCKEGAGNGNTKVVNSKFIDEKNDINVSLFAKSS